MLPSDLLMHRYSGEAVVPKRLPLNASNLAIAQQLITCFAQAKAGKRGDLNRVLQELEGDSTDYRLKRGLAHLLTSSFSTFETISPLDPPTLRQQVFRLAAESVASPQATVATLTRVADRLSQALGHEVSVAQVRDGLYADRLDHQILTEFEAPTPEALIDRYNLSQVQGVFLSGQPDCDPGPSQ